jgi:hypothetical protein
MITCTSGEIAALGGHRESHRALLRAIEPLVDAVVVPTSRPVQQLAVAVKITEALGSRFVVLCSREARAADFPAWIGERPGLWWLTIGVPNSYQHPWLEFATSRVTEAKVERLGDLSLKRNLGVLDDDIEEMDDAAVWRGAAALDISDAAFCAEYWRWFLRARAEIIAQIASRIAKQSLSDVTYAVLLSLKVADERRAGLSAEQCAVYLKTWKRDTADWCARWARLQRSSTLRQAVASLGLVQHTQSHSFDPPKRKSTCLPRPPANIPRRRLPPRR